MLLIVLTVIWALADAAFALDATMQPVDPVVLNGSGITLNCTLNEPLGGRTAGDLEWRTCQVSPVGFRCSDIAVSHDVEAVNNRTSLLHLRDLRMPRQGEREGTFYGCCFDCDMLASRNILEVSTKVYVGVPPYPVENLQCFSRNKINFTCSWERTRYTGLGDGNTYVKYKQVISNEPWHEIKLDRDSLQFSRTSLMFEMEIYITQENRLGNSTTKKINFAALTQTIPNPPQDVGITFFKKGDDGALSMRLDWQLPREWRQDHHSLLEYRIDYKDGRSDNFTRVVRPNSFTRNFTVWNVEPYANYTVRVACKLSGADSWSAWSPLLTTLSPEAAPSGEVLGLQDAILHINQNPYKRDVQITWQPPSLEKRNGIIRGYRIDVETSSLEKLFNVTVSVPACELPDLDKFQSYTVRVAAYTVEGAVGPFTELELPDLTREPAMVENVKVLSNTSDSILVSWDEPSNPQGEILGYTVKCREIKSPNIIQSRPLNDGLTKQLRISGLLPYTEYEISVVIHNRLGQSVPVKETITTKFDMPSRPRNLRDMKSSSSEIKLSWDTPSTLNGPLLGYKIRYWPSTDPPDSGVNKSVSKTHAVLKVNCSRFQEAVPFLFQVAAYTGLEESDMLQGAAVMLETEMCGNFFATTSLIIGVLITAFSVLCLVFCFYTVKRSSLMKPPPDPYFIDGILDISSDKFKTRLGTRHQEKEDYDILKTCESVHDLSSGSSSDQGFHEMPLDVERCSSLAIGVQQRLPNTRHSSGYGHSLRCPSELDAEQEQRMLSKGDEYCGDEDPVFSCPEDVDDCSGPVNSYKTQSLASGIAPPSPESVRIPMDNKESVQYTSRQESPILNTRSPSRSPAASPKRLSSGSESESMNYLQLGAFLPQPLSPRDATRPDPGEESDTNYSQMAMQGTVPAQVPGQQPPAYESVWPSETTPEKLDLHGGDQNPAWMDGLNNNSKEIPDIHAIDPFRSPREIIVATAFSPETPTDQVAPQDNSPSLPRLSSTGSDDYIDIVGGSSSPRANPLPPITSPGSRSDASCQDYVLQCELPPASPQETTVL